MSSKLELRKLYLRKRRSLSNKALLQAENDLLKIVGSGNSFFKNKKISCYWSIGKEMPTHNLIAMFSEMGSEIYLPQINNKSSVMKFNRLEDKSKLIKNQFGISESLGTKEIMPENLDLILLPCVCFDKQGYRIGMGKGYYDYSLEKLSGETNKIYLLAHEFQKVNSCFPEKHDIRAQGCITDSEFYNF